MSASSASSRWAAIFLALASTLSSAWDDGRHADRAGAGAVGAHAHLHLVGVAMDDVDRVDADPEPLGDELREGRFVALAVAVRTGQHLDRADRVDSHFRRFPKADAGAKGTDRLGRRDAAGLDVAGHADAAQLAIGLGLGLAGREAVIVGGLHGGVERSTEIAAIIGHDHRRLVRELGDEVLAPQVRGLTPSSRAAVSMARSTR